MNREINLIVTALKGFGAKGRVHIERTCRGEKTRFLVNVNEKYFGIFDTVKNTFVD